MKVKSVLSQHGVKGIENTRDLQFVADFSEYKIGDSGFVVDLMTSLKAFGAFDFDQCYERATSREFNQVHFKAIHAKDLLREKEATNRPKDQGDIDFLKSN